jgi:O-antigen ligase
VGYIESSRFFGTWDEPNAMALALVPVIGLLIAVIRTKLFFPARLLAFACAILGFVAVMLSLSRGGMLCAIVLLIAILSADKYRFWIAGIVTGLVLVVATITPTDIFGRLETLTKGGGDSSISQRLQLVSAGMDIIEKSFPFGVGYGNFQTYSIDYAQELPHGMISHNSYIDVIADSGLVGIVLFLGAIVSLFMSLKWSGRRFEGTNFAGNSNVCLGASLLAICLAMMFLSAAGYVSFWLVMTLISIYPKVFPDAARE